MNLLDVLGWAGTFIVVGSYVAMRAGKIKQEGTFYELCNVIGPIMIAVDAWFHQLYSVVALQAVWATATALTWRQNSLDATAKQEHRHDL
jgi:hypothetical protein